MHTDPLSALHTYPCLPTTGPLHVLFPVSNALYQLVFVVSFPSDLSSSLTSCSCSLRLLTMRSPRTCAFPVQGLCGWKFTPITLLVLVKILTMRAETSFCSLQYSQCP